ncbi:MAG TPA: cytochrome ubiquinol oxidase subunit I [Candidatus Limnocylindrales bacterium]|nr:cytochrome ubiquinol oxidase subunit I [Candidatus Limnocylindrales bacterium]
MDAETLSRLQFAFTISFHFIFPPLSMGLGLMLVVLGLIYVRTRDPKWRRLSFFWVKVYGLIFALGVATGVVQEFEFGMNWAEYSRFVGNVFGSLLAAEGVFAFFLEGGFLGLMLFGGNRLGPRLWLFSIVMVVIGAHFSALWILMANSWMQTPQGFTVVSDPAPTRAVMTDFWQVVNTPSFIPRLMHVFMASWTVGAALMLSVSSWYLLRKRHIDLAKANLKVALPLFIVFASVNVVIFGANQAVEVTQNQPLKLAADEGLWQSESCARMFIVGWVDETTQTTTGISIPCLLSFLAYQDVNATVAGIDSFAPAPIPPINIVFQVYHFMIVMGPALAGIGLLGGLMFLWRRRLYESRLVLWLLVITVFIGEATITAGWWTAEIGRQPWIVYNVLLTADGVSPVVSAADVVFSLGLFVALYVLLFVLFLFLLNRKIQAGPEELEDVETVAVSTLPDTFRDIFSRQPRAG